MRPPPLPRRVADRTVWDAVLNILLLVAGGTAVLMALLVPSFRAYALAVLLLGLAGTLYVLFWTVLQRLAGASRDTAPLPWEPGGFWR